jgi:hypothetical protein
MTYMPCTLYSVPSPSVDSVRFLFNVLHGIGDAGHSRRLRCPSPVLATDPGGAVLAREPLRGFGLACVGVCASETSSSSLIVGGLSRKELHEDAMDGSVESKSITMCNKCCFCMLYIGFRLS